MSLSASKVEAKYGVSIFGEVINLPLSVLQSQTNLVRKLTQTLSQIRTTIIQKLLGSITDFVSVLFFVPILFFYVPLFDLVLVIISRLRRRKNVYVASRDHTFHRLEKSGLPIQHAVLLMHGVSLSMSMIGYLCLNLNPFYANLVFVLTLLFGLFAIIRLDKNYS